MVAKFQDAKEATADLVKVNYARSTDDPSLERQISECSPKGPLCINIVKHFYDERQACFLSYGRIISGTLKQGQRVKILGENYSLDDTEDMSVATLNSLYLMQEGGQYKVQVDQLSAGNWVLIADIDKFISKTATIWEEGSKLELAETFRPIDFGTTPVVRVACEPLNPSDLPKMLEGLKKVSKGYPAAEVKVEESGEHIVIGTGELYMDSLFMDLRRVYTNETEIKISEPFVSIAESVADTSSVRCTCETPNKKNQFSMMAQPLERGLSSQIEFMAGNFSGIEDILVGKFGWDEMTANSIWSFGPHQVGTNMLVDFTLGFETDEQRLSTVKHSMIQGFQWATKEGPLCEEPIKNVKFKLLQANLANEPIFRGGGQIIPTSRRVAYSSFLLANPRIMEPVFVSEVHCPSDCIEVINSILLKRRAHIVHQEPKGGTPFHFLRIEIPALESFGFETDVRSATMGQAMVLSWYDHWEIAPGDPLDKEITLLPLEPSPVPHIARELMVKQRRRKGLLDDVSVVRFFDSKQMIELAKHDMSLQTYF
mmetsp:Transcript_3345/g.5577  ORF Transcript_3345/g.5577 Transcript_3345/m.5577 type:complete len:541 (-) Transcript_3345:13-1635(-)